MSSTIRRLYTGFTAFGYLFALAEVSLGHLYLLRGFLTNPFMWIPFMLSPIGFTASVLVTISNDKRVIQIFRAVMVLSVIAGMLGTLFHLLPKLQVAPITLDILRSDPPLAAPPLFIFLGYIGYVATLK